MNGIKIDFNKITNTDPNENIFELRKKVYDELLDKVFQHIDYLYEKLANDQKITDISHRSIKNLIDKESLSMLYKGIEIPIMDKTCIILDNIQYIPIFQAVDKSVHLQKDGKYIVIKNNVRNTFLKMDGRISHVLYKNATIPLLPYLLYIYKNVKEMLIDLGYTIIESNLNELDLNNGQYYLVPEFYENTFIVVLNDFPEGSWKSYFLSPFDIKHFEFNQKICNRIIDQINNNMIPEISEDGKSNNEIMKDIKNESIIDNEIAEKKERNKTIEEKNVREYILIPHKTDQETLDKIFNIINTYHLETRTQKKNITKMYLETSLYKFTCKDITMNDLSIFDIIINDIRDNKMIPLCYNIADISQKNIRFMEWYAQKLSSVRSYPEQNIIMEIAKTEQKRIYDTSVNPISELAMMSRVNTFGKGALPRESANVVVRNLHDSYKGVIDPINSPAGINIGISLHLTPDVSSTDLLLETSKLCNNNSIEVLYRMQKEEDNDNESISAS